MFIIMFARINRIHLQDSRNKREKSLKNYYHRPKREIFKRITFQTSSIEILGCISWRCPPPTTLERHRFACDDNSMFAIAGRVWNRRNLRNETANRSKKKKEEKKKEKGDTRHARHAHGSVPVFRKLVVTCICYSWPGEGRGGSSPGSLVVSATTMKS